MSDNDNISFFGKGKGKKPLSEDKLMAYFEGKLSPEEQHEVEEWLADEGMESDALEGMSNINAGEAKRSIDRLNHGLRSTLHGSKRKRRQLKTDHYTWVAIAIILLLVVVGYILVRMAR